VSQKRSFAETIFQAKRRVMEKHTQSFDICIVCTLEWSYEAKAPDVQAEWLEGAAELLVLRHDTLRIIDGAFPRIEADQARGAGPVQTSETQTEQVSSSNEEQKLSSSVPTEQAPLARSRKKAGSQPVTSDTYTFSEDVQISLKRFEESGVARVECPGYGRTWTLSPSGGVLHFKAHDKHKMNTPNTGRRWVRGEGETDWNMVGGESK
jgi:hypothetical protein